MNQTIPAVELLLDKIAHCERHGSKVVMLDIADAKALLPKPLPLLDRVNLRAFCERLYKATDEREIDSLIREAAGHLEAQAKRLEALSKPSEDAVEKVARAIWDSATRAVATTRPEWEAVEDTAKQYFVELATAALEAANHQETMREALVEARETLNDAAGFICVGGVHAKVMFAQRGRIGELLDKIDAALAKGHRPMTSQTIPAVELLPKPCAFEAPAGLHPSGFDPSRYEYRFSMTEGRERHDWIAHGEYGAVNIWAEPTSPTWRDEHWIGGIEGHSKTPDEYQDAAKPSQEMCWLLLAPCWHDGSSLQFSEEVEQRLPPPTGSPMSGHILDNLKPLLRRRYRSWLAEPASAIEARRVETRRGSMRSTKARRRSRDAQRTSPND